MNRIVLIITTLFPSLLFAQQVIPHDSLPPIVVMELFSSENCSGCPPADMMMYNISINAAKKHFPVYVLEEDIDYMDVPDWRDAFGSKQSSQRQDAYLDFQHNTTHFTPQIIVNGTTEVYAASTPMADNAINNALHRAALVTISVTFTPSSDTAGTMDYRLSATDTNWVINFALVQKNAVSHITGGENKGLDITHVNVMRQMVSEPVVIPDGIVQLHNIPKYAANTYSVIAFVQDKLTMKIVGAVQIDI